MVLNMRSSSSQTFLVFIVFYLSNFSLVENSARDIRRGHILRARQVAHLDSIHAQEIEATLVVVTHYQAVCAVLDAVVQLQLQRLLYKAFIHALHTLHNLHAVLLWDYGQVVFFGHVQGVRRHAYYQVHPVKHFFCSLQDVEVSLVKQVEGAEGDHAPDPALVIPPARIVCIPPKHFSIRNEVSLAVLLGEDTLRVFFAGRIHLHSQVLHYAQILEVDVVWRPKIFHTLEPNFCNAGNEVHTNFYLIKSLYLEAIVKALKPYMDPVVCLLGYVLISAVQCDVVFGTEGLILLAKALPFRKVLDIVADIDIVVVIDESLALMLNQVSVRDHVLDIQVC